MQRFPPTFSTFSTSFPSRECKEPPCHLAEVNSRALEWGGSPTLPMRQIKASCDRGVVYRLQMSVPVPHQSRFQEIVLHINVLGGILLIIKAPPLASLKEGRVHNLVGIGTKITRGICNIPYWHNPLLCVGKT